MKVSKTENKQEEYIFEKPLPCYIERGNRRIGDVCDHTYALSKIY